MNRTLHFFWTSPEGNASIPDDISKNIDLWKSTHPEYRRIIWDEARVKTLATDNGRHDVADAMDASRLLAMKSDIARVALMVFEGGVYSDLKNKPLASFLDDMSDQSAPLVTQHPPTIDNYERFICNALLIGSPGQAFFKEYLDLIVGNVNGRKPGGVHDVTGGGALKRTLGNPFRSDVVVKMADEVWGPQGAPRFVTRTGASYNGAGNKNHWSKLQGDGLYTAA